MRVISWFSCGAASAVATILAAVKYGEIEAVYCRVVEEHEDNLRFLDDFTRVTGIPVKVSKQDCYAHLTRLGLRLPTMYHLGYSNNNCIGCVKGGMGYWNKIRKDFPDRFDKMAKVERLIGHAINKDDNGPVYLDELAPTRGRFKQDMPADCGFTCEVSNADT